MSQQPPTTDQRPTLDDLEDRARFSARHIGPGDDEQRVMLDAVGAADLDALIDEAVPASIRLDAPLALPDPITESEAIAAARQVADENRVMTSLIGMGYHDTITPPVIRRNVLEDPAWYTAYTPYQPEISQGRLEALLNFQTLVADLTGLPLANASLLDEGTAAAEAMTMARRGSKSDSPVFYVDEDCHPQTIAVVETRAEPIGVEIVVGPAEDVPSACFGALLAFPGSTGELRDLAPAVARVHASGGLAVVVCDPLASVLTRSPAAAGADIAVGSMQRFGVPMGFGGPHAGFIAAREALARTLPGRMVGVSVDDAGRPALRLALQTREQHIRREKATSNVCTAQVLLAVTSAMYAAWHGPEGLRRIAGRVNRLTGILVAGLRAGGVDVPSRTWFDTIRIAVPGRADEVLAAAAAEGLNLRRIDDDTVGVTLDETSTREVVERVWRALGVAAAPAGELDREAPEGIPAALGRTEELLTHPVFSRHHTEHDMLRYLRRLSDRDLALDRTMIPLGSCTMKLNATTEMEPITWPEFAGIHPFAPLEQASGYLRMIRELEDALCEVTGYDAVSLQPNAGSQGELAGLLAIRAYHRERGEAVRDICLIPSSAHGTNAASAVMAGMRVEVVACDADGNVDLADLRERAGAAGARLAALMVTYPSTHGVFEEEIGEICAAVHDHGGQVYVDGANLNALVGLAKPGRFGADVSHLNLHKTFCIPHGGGGPGVGPVAVRAHLAPHLPNHPLVPEAGPASGVGPISAAPWGSAGILVIPWVYIALMGAAGLRRATEVAILSANYVAARLGDHYPVLYTGARGRVAHECILDLRPIRDASGVTVDDVAKRLMDYGFHAPTMSFPVAGTLMVEPTESESLAELDRFCAAMIAIRDEIRRVEAGEWDAADAPLRHAPHTAEDLTSDAWERGYPRELAAYPLPGVAAAKYWPPVGRIDAAHGDRNLVCSCPPVEELAQM